MPRDSLEEKFSILVTRKERKALEKSAGGEGRTLSAYVRRVLFGLSPRPKARLKAPARR